MSGAGAGEAARADGPGVEAETGAAGDARPAMGPRAVREEGADEEPCLRCGVPLPARLMGCKGGHCPNCGHPYPHGDCSD